MENKDHIIKLEVDDEIADYEKLVVEKSDFTTQSCELETWRRQNKAVITEDISNMIKKEYKCQCAWCSERVDKHGDIRSEFDEIMIKQECKENIKQELKCMEGNHITDDDAVTTKKSDAEHYLQPSTDPLALKSDSNYCKSYKCSICWKTFQTATKLKLHEVVHTGDRNYHCQICRKSFSQPQHLNRHQLTHTNDKKHTCDQGLF